jgi:hypothetical protein
MWNRIGGSVVALLFFAVAVVHASEDNTMHSLDRWAQAHDGSKWTGSSELWVDPSGNEGETSDATLQVGQNIITYTWAYKGTPHSGELSRVEAGLHWKDSWHQAEGVVLTSVPGHGALTAGEYSYPAGSGPDWHWRIKLAQRPDDSLVLQMTNIAPWGEEARAVRMVLHRAE